MKQEEYDLDRVKTNLEFLIERYSCDHPIGNLARTMLALLHEYKRALPIILAEDSNQSGKCRTEPATQRGVIPFVAPTRNPAGLS